MWNWLRRSFLSFLGPDYIERVWCSRVTKLVVESGEEDLEEGIHLSTAQVVSVPLHHREDRPLGRTSTAAASVDHTPLSVFSPYEYPTPIGFMRNEVSAEREDRLRFASERTHLVEEDEGSVLVPRVRINDRIDSRLLNTAGTELHQKSRE